MGYNKIILHGNQVCDYVYIQKTQVNAANFKTIKSEPKNWNSNTLMLSTFDNNSLSGGNISLTEKIEGYEIRRQRIADSYTEYIGTISRGTDDISQPKFIVDYAAKNNSDYIYHLYPISKDNVKEVALSPLISPEVHTDWNCWALMVVDESNEDNIFYLNKMFKFEINVVPEDMNNNSTKTVTQNFTRYPTVQHSTSNYWGGSLSALCGFVSCTTGEYVQTPDMAEELKQLSSDTRRKFLKDITGNIWEVEITAPINISTNNTVMQNPQTVKISWIEVGDAKGISIVNNYNVTNTSLTSWILTKDGRAIPYVKYVWDEHYKWDNEYIWTSNDDVLNTSVSNLGRELF